MGLGAWLFGGAAESAAKPVEAVGNALDKLFTSDDERAQAAIVMERLRQQPDLLQAEITKLEAQHPSVFVAGWRPALGWVCVISIAVYYIPRFALASYLWASQVITTGTWMAPPEVGIADILGLVGTVLGSSVIRSWEKKNEVAR